MASAASVPEMALESCAFDYADIERIELPEIDCALLTALLEESHVAAEDGDSNMVGSPCSAPQPPAETAAPISDGLHGDREDCGLEDVLSLLDSSSASSLMHVDDSCWAEYMDVVVPSPPSDDNMGDWLMGTGDVGGMVGYEFDSEEYYHQHLYSYYGGDVTVEDGCSTPLWQMSY